MRTDHSDEFDRILDAALAGYSEREPWPGLTDRVVARLQPRRRVGWLPWAVPVCVLAGMVLLLVHWRAPQPVPVAVNPPVRRVETPVRTKEEVVVSRSRPRRRPTLKPVHLATQPVFPTPSPVSAEERALLKLVTSAPEIADEVVAARERFLGPLTVKPLDIPPLTDGG